MYILDAADRKKITDAMNDFMWDVGRQTPGSQQRTACVYFRPRQANDRGYINIQYGTGCGALVSPSLIFRHDLVRNCFFEKILK